MSSAATYLVVAALLTAAAADLPGTALTSQPDVASPAAGASAEPPPDGAFVMNPGSGASVGGWTEIGRTPVVRDDDPSLGDLRELAVVGDQLFAVGTVEETSDGPSRHVLLRSADGLAWLPVAVPGTDPIVTELAASASGLLAGGSVVDQGERRGSLWASMDGETWTEMPAPPFAEVRRIVSADAPLVVVDAGDRPYLWVSDDGGEDWSTSRRLNDFSIARGPGGFLMWRGGGQDETTPTRLLHSPDARDFQEVDLPSALTDGDEAQAGVSIFALDDQWVLVPSEVKLPDSIFTSADGLEWEEAPRPVRMLEPVGWIASVGDGIQAFGHATPEEADPTELVPTPSALWAWTPRDPSEEPAVLDPEGDDTIEAPVAFGDSYIAIGRDGGRGAHITVWRYGPPAAG